MEPKTAAWWSESGRGGAYGRAGGTAYEDRAPRRKRQRLAQALSHGHKWYERGCWGSVGATSVTSATSPPLVSVGQRRTARDPTQDRRQPRRQRCTSTRLTGPPTHLRAARGPIWPDLPRPAAACVCCSVDHETAAHVTAGPHTAQHGTRPLPGNDHGSVIDHFHLTVANGTRLRGTKRGRARVGLRVRRNVGDPDCRNTSWQGTVDPTEMTEIRGRHSAGRPVYL
jgi:hypothetical protein